MDSYTSTSVDAVKVIEVAHSDPSTTAENNTQSSSDSTTVDHSLSFASDNADLKKEVAELKAKLASKDEEIQKLTDQISSLLLNHTNPTPVDSTPPLSPKNIQQPVQQQQQEQQQEQLPKTSEKPSFGQVFSPFETTSVTTTSDAGHKKIIPVDSQVPRSDVEVYSDATKTYSVNLNQTNIMTNSNKFYIIQLLNVIESQEYILFTRWGRVGMVGQQALTPFPNLESAKTAFQKKLDDKTGFGYNQVQIFL